LLLNLASTLYSRVVTTRRRWYAGDPARQRRLSRPVISVGNLRVGGAGKTPVVAWIARELARRGERPAILSRGYARRVSSRTPTIVSDGFSIRAGFETAGDEALMLARALPTIPVVVCASRYEAGLVAEGQLNATVHLLDDGFQHLQLARTVDVLVVDEGDLADRPLPAGRLREPIASARHANGFLTVARGPALDRLRSALGVRDGFEMTRRLAAIPRPLHAGGEVDATEPVMAVAGVARPERFFDDLASAGWRVAHTVAFRDHHAFTPDDIARIEAAARAAGVRTVLTTEKDAARMDGLDLHDLVVAAVPLMVDIDTRFMDWLVSRLGTR
jgi:tetraacyldisaccharide 4'-kinase